jgi:hypothetical protein
MIAEVNLQLCSTALQGLELETSRRLPERLDAVRVSNMQLSFGSLQIGAQL